MPASPLPSKNRTDEPERIPFLISKADRSYMVSALRGMQPLYAHELADRLDATRCTTCGGNGFAPYVGGDDDDTPCATCGGSGFNQEDA